MRLHELRDVSVGYAPSSPLLKSINNIIGYIVLFLVFGAVAAPILHPLTGSFLQESGGEAIPGHIRSMSSDELLKMLHSSNEIAVGHAIRMLGERRDPKVTKKLIDLFNKRDSQPSLDRLACEALSRIIREQITKNPSNLALLRPYFNVILKGTVPEQTSMITVLADIKEPLAIPMLHEMSRQSQKPVQEAARSALSRINPGKDHDYINKVLYSIETRYIVGLLALIMLAILTSVAWLRKRIDIQHILLLGLAIVLLGWITILSTVYYAKSIPVDRTIREAVRQRDLSALKTMIYKDFPRYPGFSYTAQWLVKSPNERTVQCLAALPMEGPDDEPIYKNYMKGVIDWTLSRIVSSQLYSDNLKRLLTSDMPEVRAEVATILGKLSVKNPTLIAHLELLEHDSDEKVRDIATKSQSRVKNYPVWSWSHSASD